jgi:hypothetical protein
MPEKGRKEVKKVSRRNFLRSAGFIVGGAASLGIGGLALTGCGIDPNCQTAGEPKTTTQTSAQENTEYVGECVCPDCYASVPHPRGVPCRMISCPECGTSMGRGAI